MVKVQTRVQCNAAWLAGMVLSSMLLQHAAADAELLQAHMHAELQQHNTQQQQPANLSQHSLLPSNKLICDGSRHSAVLPGSVSPYTAGADITCARSSSGSCSAQPDILCKPYTDTHGPVGPVSYGDTTGSDARLLIPPDNPLLFRLAPNIHLTFLSWRVYDVGTGGARLLARYPPGSGLSAVVVNHQWTSAPSEKNELGDCGPCGDCSLGKGIQDMEVNAEPGAGFTSFELSQMFPDPRCGSSCFDLDGSFWSGMTYACVKPTCKDTDLSRAGAQQFVCPAGYSFAGSQDPAESPSLTNCCSFVQTCGDVSMLEGAQQFPCLAVGGCDEDFASYCYEFRQGSADTPLTGDRTQDLALCCDPPQIPQSDPDVYVVKRAQRPTSQPVNSIFTFTIEVGVRGLVDALARSVVLEDELPDGLVLDGIQETFVPFENACGFATAQRFRCDWPSLVFGDVRLVIITVLATRAGRFSNNATVSTASIDVNPDNNMSKDTVQALGACCNSQASPARCQDVLSKADCTSPSTFYELESCQEINCEFVAGGACCLKRWGTCVDRTFEGACDVAQGAWHENKLCSEVRRRGLCKTPTGACCNVKDGTCSEALEITKCDLKWSTWWMDGSCTSDGYCSGSCCDTASGNCYQSKKQDCTAPTQLWSLYGQCDPLKCPQQGQCTPPWYRCKPAIWGKQDECCSGYECQAAPNGCKVGKYVCQPKVVPQCGKEGFSCGGRSGGVCCKGYACYWDYRANKGSCWPQPNPSYCGQAGSSCLADQDCCYGSRCYCPSLGNGGHGKDTLYSRKHRDALLSEHGQPGQCVPTSFDKCHKDCYDFTCYTERQRDCGAYYATAAVKPGTQGDTE